MARTPVFHEEKKELIVKAALASFSKYGYEATTNKLIAQEAGKLIAQDGKALSPGLIYHYFPEGKQQLFAACLEQLPTLAQFREAILANLDQPPEIFFRAVAHTYNEILKHENVLPIMRMVFMEGGRKPELIQTLLGIFLPNLVQPILSYLEKQIKEGRARVQKPDQIAAQLFGPLIVRRILKNNLNQENAPFVTERILVSDDEEFIEALVSTILAGLFN